MVPPMEKIAENFDDLVKSKFNSPGQGTSFVLVLEGSNRGTGIQIFNPVRPRGQSGPRRCPTIRCGDASGTSTKSSNLNRPQSSRWKENSSTLFQNMLAQDQAKELSLKDFLLALIEHGTGSSFFLCFIHWARAVRVSRQPPASEIEPGRKKDHKGIVHRHHSRVIGQAEGESSMDQALFIHPHPGIHGQRDLRELSAFNPFYFSHQILGYGQVGILGMAVTVVHSFLPSFQIPSPNPAIRGTNSQTNFRCQRAKRSECGILGFFA
jgi:hypothetical protein